MDYASCTGMLLLSQEHIDAIGNDNPLAAFWMSYHDMADIMLGLLRASREGDWLLHLASIRAMIPCPHLNQWVSFFTFILIAFQGALQVFINGSFSRRRQRFGCRGKQHRLLDSIVIISEIQLNEKTWSTLISSSSSYLLNLL